MPTAGDEGYEQLVICPYERAHEIRRGRIQFHLDKCRKNHKDKQGELLICPYNSCHNVPSAEIEYHTEEDCGSRANWQRYTHEIGDVSCPVKDLVPVNAATVPDSDENWDHFESQGSVLQTLKTQAEEKGVLRMLQCESKAKRKKFRREEQLRHSQMQGHPPMEVKSTVSIKNNVPSRNLTVVPSISFKRQDPSAAIATINSQLDNLDLQPSPSTPYVPSEKSYNNDAIPSSAVSDCSYASASSTRPGTAMSSALSSSTSRPTNSRPSTAMSSALSSSTSRPTSSRPSTAMSIAASVNRPCPANKVLDNDGFCQIPIPGLGRGSAARRKTK